MKRSIASTSVVGTGGTRGLRLNINFGNSYGAIAEFGILLSLSRDQKLLSATTVVRLMT